MKMPELLLKSVNIDTPFHTDREEDSESSMSVSKITSNVRHGQHLSTKLFSSTHLIFDYLLSRFSTHSSMRPMAIRVPCKRKIKLWQKLKHFRTHKQCTNALIYLTRQRFFFHRFSFSVQMPTRFNKMNGFHFHCTIYTDDTLWIYGNARHFKLYTIRISLANMLKTWIVAFVLSFFFRRWLAFYFFKWLDCRFAMNL